MIILTWPFHPPPTHPPIHPSPVDVVRVGAHDLRQRGAAQDDLPVEKVILHPGYAFPSSSHDLVLLRLYRPVRLGPHVRFSSVFCCASFSVFHCLNLRPLLLVLLLLLRSLLVGKNESP